MFRRPLATLAAAAMMAIALPLLAAERITFVLTNGEKISGTVVFHTEERTNIRADKNEFNVGLDGSERAIPFNQVSILDFASGTPSNDELAALPDEGTHLIVMRNGASKTGKFIDMIGGDTVRWENRDGGREDIRIVNVRRVYLQPDNARGMFNYSRPAGNPSNAAPPRGGGFGRGLNSSSTELERVTVRGNVAWTTTAVGVRKGDQLVFATNGQVTFIEGKSTVADGSAQNMNNRYPVRVMGAGGLIARVGNSAPFPIGSNQQPITMPATGLLMLGINDDYHADNSGEYVVSVRRPR